MTNILTTAALTVKLVLPAFSDFAGSAQLDLPLPITEERVTKSFVGKTQPTVMAVVDGRHQFNWRSRVDDKDLGMKADLLTGWINYRDLSNAVAGLEGEARFMPLTRQESLITTNEARDIALGFLNRAGYDLRKAKVNPPWVRQYSYRPDDPLQAPLPLPAFAIKFIKKGVKKPEWHHLYMEIEVSGLTKKITRFKAMPEMYKAVSVDLKKYHRSPKYHHSLP